MKATGEVMGIDADLGMAAQNPKWQHLRHCLPKVMSSSGLKDRDKEKAIDIIKEYHDLDLIFFQQKAQPK